jgi:hypothetical protein
MSNSNIKQVLIFLNQLISYTHDLFIFNGIEIMLQALASMKIGTIGENELKKG